MTKLECFCSLFLYYCNWANRSFKNSNEVALIDKFLSFLKKLIWKFFCNFKNSEFCSKFPLLNCWNLKLERSASHNHLHLVLVYIQFDSFHFLFGLGPKKLVLTDLRLFLFSTLKMTLHLPCFSLITILFSLFLSPRSPNLVLFFLIHILANTCAVN